MSLQPCRECQKEGSTAAPVCPHCGIAQPVPVSWTPRTPARRTEEARKSAIAGAVVGAVAGVILAAIGSGLARPIGFFKIVSEIADGLGYVGCAIIGAIVGGLIAFEKEWRKK